MGIMKILKNMKRNDKLYTQYKLYLVGYNLLQDELVHLVDGYYDELYFESIGKFNFIKLSNQGITPYTIVYGVNYALNREIENKDVLFYLPISKDIDNIGRKKYFQEYLKKC